jgi:hypothetical protein
MFSRKLNGLVIVGLTAGLVALVSAGPQAAAPKTNAPKTTAPPSSGKPAAAAPVRAADAQELSEHPEILTQDFNPQLVTLFGVKVGDKTAKVSVANMDRMAGTMPGIMKLQEGYQLRYNPITLTVTSLVVSNRNALIKANLLDRYDVEFRFGKADISDERHAVYLSRRMLVTFNSQDITGIEVR